jgi:hypothetical protein
VQIRTQLLIRFVRLGFALPLIYVGIAFTVFQWRNPIANGMSIYRDFGAVVTWQKLERYQFLK